MSKYLVFDVGGTFIKYGLMDEGYLMLDKGKIPQTSENLDEFIVLIKKILQKYPEEFSGVSLSLPCRIDTKRDYIITGGALEFLNDTFLGERLRKEWSLPVTLANDAHCAAIAESSCGALENIENGCVIVLGTGIGAGIILEKKLWQGSYFSAGQLSAMPVNFDKIYDGIGTLAISGLDNMWTGRVSTPGLLNTYAKIKGLGGLPPELDGISFFKNYESGEDAAKKALKVFGRQAAAGIYSIQSVLDLQMYAIGGGISARPEITEVIQDSLDELFDLLPLTPFQKPKVVTCKFGNDANLIGALQIHLEKAQ